MIFTIIQILLFMTVLLLLVKPLGAYMARVYQGQRVFGLERVLSPVENTLYRLSGVRATEEMGWQQYALALLLFVLSKLPSKLRTT
jgi:K+-transporting ATPase ATPase A chain